MAASPCVVSVASIWEIDLKHRFRKLSIAPRRFRDEMRWAGAAIPSISDDHVLTAVKPAETHRDPFDRLLLSVAEAENLVLLTAHASSRSDATSLAFHSGVPDGNTAGEEIHVLDAFQKKSRRGITTLSSLSQLRSLLAEAFRAAVGKSRPERS